MVHETGRTTSRDATGAGGFTLVETVISMVIVGIMLVAAMATVSASARAQKITSDRATAGALAADLMSEVLAQSYEDPTSGATIVFGREADEQVGSTRAAFDDIDDYNGWTETKIQQKDGTAIPGFTGWSRTVTVTLASASDPTLASTGGADVGVKRITVKAIRNGAAVVTLNACRTKAQ